MNEYVIGSYPLVHLSWQYALPADVTVRSVREILFWTKQNKTTIAIGEVLGLM